MTGATQMAGAEGFAPHPVTGRGRTAIFGTLWSLLNTLVPNLSGALVFFLSATFLGPADFGQLSIAAGVVSVALAVSPQAFGEALVQRSTLAPGHANVVFWLNAGLGIAYAIALAALAPVLATWFDARDLVWLLPLLALKVPLDLLAAVPSAMIVRTMRFRLVAIRTTIASAVGAGLCIALLVADFGLLALALSQLAVSATILVVAFWTSGWRPGLAFRLGHLKDLFRYGLFSSGQRMLGTVRVDHLVTGALAGPAFLGMFVFAQRVFRLLADLAGGALSSVLHVVLASMQGDIAQVRRAFGLASFGAAAIGFPVFAGAALVLDDVVMLLFSPDWSAAGRAAQILCCAGFLATLGIVQGALLRGLGKPDWLFWYQLVQELTTVLVIALTWRFGLDVMAAAIVAKTFLVWPVSMTMTVRLLGTSPMGYLSTFAGPVAATAGMAVCVAALPAADGVAGLLFQVSAGAAVYAGLLLAFSRKRLSSAAGILRSTKGAPQ